MQTKNWRIALPVGQPKRKTQSTKSKNTWGIKMICENCGKKYKTSDSTHVMRSKPTPVTFCCYKCYTDFWMDVKNFMPLPEYTKNTLITILLTLAICSCQPIDGYQNYYIWEQIGG